MNDLNMICCPITNIVVDKYKDLANTVGVTPLKMYKEGAGMTGLAFIRGISLLGTVLAVPYQGRESKSYLVLWVDPDNITDEDTTKNIMKRMIHDIVMLIPRRDIVVSGNNDSHAGILIKAIEETCLFKISYKDDEFYAISESDDSRNYMYENAVDNTTFEGCEEGIDATWSPYVVSAKGPTMLNNALKEFMMSHSDNFNAIYDYAISKGKYTYCPLKYDLFAILDEYSIYFSDLSTYIVSILRPANTQVDCDNVERITKAVDIDANFRQKLFDNHEIVEKNPLLNDSVAQLNVFIHLTTFLDTVTITFNNLPHLDSRCASLLASVINVYGYSLTEFLKRFCKELIAGFNVMLDCMQHKPSPPESDNFMLL